MGSSPFLVDLLRSQLCGVTLAAALLVPISGAVPGAPTDSVGKVQVDGNPILVVRSFLSGGPQPLLTTRGSRGEASINDALRLRQVSQLPITTLARILGVSRQAYHDWTRGSNIAAQHQSRLKQVLSTVERIAEHRPDVGRFLLSSTERGQPIELIVDRGAEVIGLSLRADELTHVGPRGPVVNVARRTRTDAQRRADAEVRLSMKIVIDQEILASDRVDDEFESIGSFRIG